MIWSTLAGMWCRYAPQPRKKGTSPATMFLRDKAVGDGGADVGALFFGNFRAIEPAAAEGGHPGGNAMLQRGRSLDQPRVDVLEAGLLINGDEILDSGIPIGGIGRRPETAGDE